MRFRGPNPSLHLAHMQLRDLPSVDELARGVNDPLAVEVARTVIAQARDEIRAGADPGDLADLAAAVDEAGMLELRGLMAVAPLGEDPVAVFARLAEVREQFLAHHPGATWLSAGMSADLEHAIRAGATHVRVGSAVLGSRPPNK